MAQTTPPTIDPVPTPPIQRGDRATFSSRVDAFILWLVAAVAQFQALANNVYANALDVYANATAALGYRNAAQSAQTAAESARDLAQQYRDAALGYRDAAALSATAAAQSAAAAANSALALVGNSTTSLTLAAGSKSLTIEPGKQFVAGEPLMLVSKSDTTKFLYGVSTSYNSTNGALVVNATLAGGSGSANDWTVVPTGVQGPQGVQGTPGTGAFSNVLVMLTSQSWTVPAALFEVEMAGGPSGAWNGSRGGSGNIGGFGGASGGYVKKLFKNATIGATALCTVGTVGSAGNGTGTGSANVNPGSGTSTTFTLSGFTQLVAGGGLVSTDGIGTLSTTGGVATGGDINVPGQRGGVGSITSQSLNYIGGNGGGNPLGSPGVGFNQGTLGSPGTGFGAAAAGVYNYTANVSAGAPAVIIIRW